MCAAKSLILSLVLCAAAFLPGCSLGFSNYRPGENDALYSHLFDDIISRYDEPHWLWVRGSIMGDLNGDGKVSEEVVLATIQKGDARRPGAVEMAFLVACDVAADGKRTAIARQLLFDSSPVAAAPKPVNDLGQAGEVDFTRCRAQMVQDKVTLKETVVVCFWGDDDPGTAWYAGYGLGEGGWTKNLEIALWQSSPGFLSANLDKSVEATPLGYQLVFGVSAVPKDILAKIPDAGDAPLWGHVYARNAEGMYEQADERFGEQYRRIQGAWNQMYLKAALAELPPEEMAWFEYHLGMLNRYLGEYNLSSAFLRKAEKNAKDPALVRGVKAALGGAAVDAAVVKDS